MYDLDVANFQDVEISATRRDIWNFLAVVSMALFKAAIRTGAIG
jgi:hypothetical protein